MISRRLVAPTGRLCSVADVKALRRFDGPEEDQLIGLLIEEAGDYLDAGGGVTGRALLTQTWRAAWPSAPAERVVRLPIAPVASLSAAGYVDAEGATQVFPTASLRLVSDPWRPRVELVAGADWPAVDDREEAFWIDYVAGSPVAPPRARGAAMKLVAHWHANREAATMRDLRTTPLGFDELLASLRAPRGLM